MGHVTVRYWAAARAGAGTPQEVLPGATLGEVLDAARARHGAELARVLGRCTFLVDGARGQQETVLDAGAVVDVLPPFAGG